MESIGHTTNMCIGDLLYYYVLQVENIPGEKNYTTFKKGADIIHVSNEIARKDRNTRGHLSDLHSAIVSKLPPVNKKQDTYRLLPGKNKFFSNSGKLEWSLWHEALEHGKELFSSLNRHDSWFVDRGTNPIDFTESLVDLFGNKKDRNLSPYLSMRSSVPIEEGFIKEHWGIESILFPDELPPKLQRVVIMGRRKSLPSHIEKISREAAEYIVYSDLVGKKPKESMHAYCVSNDSIASRVLVPWPNMVKDLRWQGAIKKALTQYTKQGSGQASGLSYRKDAKKPWNVVYFDVMPKNREKGLTNKMQKCNLLVCRIIWNGTL